jgi:hypothetical protein
MQFFCFASPSDEHVRQPFEDESKAEQAKHEVIHCQALVG